MTETYGNILATFFYLHLFPFYWGRMTGLGLSRFALCWIFVNVASVPKCAQKTDKFVHGVVQISSIFADLLSP